MDYENEELENARKLIFDKHGFRSTTYKKYLRLKRIYYEKVNTKNELYAHALRDPYKLQMWPINGKGMQDHVDSAFRDLLVFGNKEIIEKALDLLTKAGIKIPEN